MSFSLPSSPKLKSKFRSSATHQSPSPHPHQSTHLPNSHPLIAELTSLRQQLAQYQKASHQTSIQLQGVRLELTLSKEKEERWERERDILKKEVEVLRTNPIPIQSSTTSSTPTSSNALTELSLAHRRLSTKLDLTESELNQSKLELNKTKLELQRLIKEREGDRSIINELRRIEDDREEELEWEKGERRKLEEQKKLCDLALAEYSNLVYSLDPTAVPPTIPTKTSSSIFHTPSLQRVSLDETTSNTSELETPPLVSGTTLSSPSNLDTPGEVISNLLIGQRGVQQLFQDFTSFLVSKDKHIQSLEGKLEELQHSYTVSQDQLQNELQIRVEAENERDRVIRDDESASKVVERYMTFTQKTHQTVHMHLNNLRERSKATTNSLRNELSTIQKELHDEKIKNSKLRIVVDEVSEQILIESTGRRREISIRLKILSAQENKSRKFENWLNKIKRIREGVEGSVVEPDILESLLDEGIDIISSDNISSSSDGIHNDIGKDKIRSWRGFTGFIKKNKSELGNDSNERNFEEESLARILLAEELVTTLVGDLQIETEKRMELERQRVDWLAKDAMGGVKVDENEGNGEGHVMFDLEDHEQEIRNDANDELVKPELHVEENPQIQSDGVNGGQTFVLDGDEDNEDEPASKDPTLGAISQTEAPPTPVSPISPLVPQLQTLFEPLTTRYIPLQKTLHDLSYSLTTLRNDLPTFEIASPTSSSPKSTRKSHFLQLSKLPPLPIPSSSNTSSDPILITILDGLHEVIEDARVDVEIALADHERVFRGFEALLNVGKVGKSGGSKDHEIMNEVREYIEIKGGNSDGKDESFNKLKGRIENIEFDLTEIKRIIHESDGMELSHFDNHDQSENLKKKNIWDTIELRTVSIPTTSTKSSFFRFSPISSSSSPLNSPSLYDGLPTPNSLSPSATHNGFNLNIDPIRRTSNMFSTVGNVSRSFSNSVIGAPRRVSGLANGLYRPGVNGKRHEHEQEEGESKGLMKGVNEEDDVE